jgi:hypothetical protein
MEKSENQRVYFSIADRQLESFADYNDFERSLVFNALFQKGILIPDIFCFISQNLIKHIFESDHPNRKSLFEACIEQGIVVPAFRNRETTSFNDALADINELEIQGVHENANKIANRLQNAAKKNPQFSPEYWPTHDIGEKFGQVVEHHLACQSPPEVDTGSGINLDELQDLWERTERWRIHCVGEARDKTKEMTGRGLRRGEIMNAVGRDLGLSKDHKVNDIAELFRYKKHSKEKKALRCFFRWVNDCYQYNQANEFGAIANFPIYDPIESLMVSSILPKEQSKMDSEPAPTIRETVPLPSINVLSKMAPSEFILAYEESGTGYFEAVETWQQEPDDANEKEAIKYLRLYAKDICKRARQKNNVKADVVIGAFVIPTINLLTAVLLLGLGDGFAPEYQVLGPSFVSLSSSSGYVVYKLREQRPKKINIEISAPKIEAQVPPEVNLT